LTLQIAFVYGVLALTIILFASEWVRLDVTALGIILALILSNTLSPREALSGFGDPLVILIAGLFIVGDALFKTGLAGQVGEKIVNLSRGNKVLALLLVIIVVAVLSAFMSSTGAVAILIPVVLNMCKRLGIKPSAIMMPLAFGALMGGMLTLIGTPPNLVVSQALVKVSGEGLGFFEFAPFGGVILFLGLIYLFLVNAGSLRKGSDKTNIDPKLTLENLITTYSLEGLMHCVKVPSGSPLDGMTVAEAKLRTQYGVTVLAYRSHENRKAEIKEVLASTRIIAGDELFVLARTDELNLLASPGGVELLPLTLSDSRLLNREVGMAEVMLSPESRLIGQTIKEAGFRSLSGLSVVAVKRQCKCEVLSIEVFNEKLEVGDILLAVGGWDSISRLNDTNSDFIILHVPEEFEHVAPNRDKAPRALLIMACMVLVLTFSPAPAVLVVMAAAMAMILSGCLTMPQAYLSISWPSIVVIAGMLPMALALDKTGGMQLATGFLSNLLEGQSSLVVLSGLFLVTSLFSQFISNTATTVLMAPVAIAMAQSLGLSQMGLLMTVAIAASTAFATPVASPVNMLVMAPGDYRFIDFLKLGTPLIAISLVVVLVMIPMFYPM
tara:strand:- start:8393 stop:10222 length:1830 start_codon:yes stop_codon:yes gene_type:complete